jgi:DNA-binding transcriptional MerR regulator
MNDSLTSETLFPIRELSARTQVNTVTIRAWERRYGLLKPQRTAKGHRLYSEEDVHTIEKILALIARGVSVGKVKAMLTEVTGLEDKQDMALWQHAITQLEMATQSYQSNQLELLIADYFVNYPVSVCRQNLFQPIFIALQKETASNKAQRSFLEGELLIYTLRRLKNHHTGMSKLDKAKPPVLLCYGENTAIWPLLFLCLELADAQVNVQLINQAVGLDSFVEISQQSRSEITLFYQDGLWSEVQTQLAKKALTEDSSIVLCGTAAIMAQIDSANSDEGTGNQIFSALPEFSQYWLSSKHS